MSHGEKFVYIVMFLVSYVVKNYYQIQLGFTRMDENSIVRECEISNLFIIYIPKNCTLVDRGIWKICRRCHI